MLAILFLMTFSFPAKSAERRAKQGVTLISASVANTASGCLQTKGHTDVVLKLSHIIFDLATITIGESIHKKSENIFLAVNTFIRNPYYVTATVNAP